MSTALRRKKGYFLEHYAYLNITCSIANCHYYISDSLAMIAQPHCYNTPAEAPAAP
jgi:hypothetical protein